MEDIKSKLKDFESVTAAYIKATHELDMKRRILSSSDDKNHYELPKDRLRLLSAELKPGDTKIENGELYIYFCDDWYEQKDFIVPWGFSDDV